MPSDSVSEVLDLAGGERIVITPSRLARLHTTAGSIGFEPFGPHLDLPLATLGWGSHVGRGGLWLAAANGAVHYDGSRFRRWHGTTPIDVDAVSPPGVGGVIPFRLATRVGVPPQVDAASGDRLFLILADRHGDRWYLLRSPSLTRFTLVRERDGRVEPIDLQAHLGLHRFAEGRLERRLTMRDGLPHDRVRSLYRSRAGDLWVGAAGGFARVVDGEIAGVHTTSKVVRAFAETPDGRLWIAAGDTLLVGDGRHFRPFRPDLAWGPELWALEAANDGALWVGGRGVLARIVGDSVERFGPEHGLRGTHISSIHEEPDGTLWMGTYEHGIHRYRGERFVPITTAHGLPHDGVWRMLRDGQGFVWMSSDVGIFRVAHSPLHEVADALERDPDTDVELEPLVFTEAQGSPSRESNRASPGGWRLADGHLVFNNIAGAVVLDPERAARPPPPPRTRIRRAVADGAELPGRMSEPVRLPPGVRHLTFEFAALSFATPAQNRYRYRLDGYDDGWLDGEGRRRAEYTGLGPGHYTFRVQGATGAGPWSEMEARYAFVVPAFFWQTWWFRGLLVAAALGGLVLAHRARVAHLLEVERLRLRIANDLHDDVGSSLSSIALLSEMLRDRTGSRDLERRQLARIAEAAGETMGALREIIWLVDPTHDNSTDLLKRMRRTAGELLNGTAVEFTPRSLPERRPLDPRLVREVFLIYKEALHNVARHAGASRVRIQVSTGSEALSLVVEDDGVGFREDQIEPGHGLGSMRARARELGGELTIERADGGGTRLTFHVKMA